MKIALGIVTLSTFGGLQRDCLALAEALRARGHEVALFAERLLSPVSTKVPLQVSPARGWTNHGRDLGFAKVFRAAVRGRFDVTVGFNKMAGLDVYYCADPCLKATRDPLWTRILWRRRVRLGQEAACFSGASSTVALLLSPASLAAYQAAWGTPRHRLRLLPPQIGRDRVGAGPANADDRRRRSAAWGFNEADILWLWVAAQPSTKGLDRVLSALASRPRARLLVAGLSGLEARAKLFIDLAQRLGVPDRVRWLGPCDDVVDLMSHADLLVHPTRLDTTGQAILEAIANGLPVVTTAAAGFAPHVTAAGAGWVVAEPFDPSAFNLALATAESLELRRRWSAAALDYAARHDFCAGLAAAAEIIERIGARHGEA